MTDVELVHREAALKDAGYIKYNTTSSRNDYSWFKTKRNEDDWEYMIEWRVWNWKKYIDTDPSLAKRPYSMEFVVLVNNEQNSRMENGDIEDIALGEEVAKDFYDFVNKHYGKH